MLPHHKSTLMLLWWRRGESNPRPLNPTLVSANYCVDTIESAPNNFSRSPLVALARVGTSTPSDA